MNHCFKIYFIFSLVFLALPGAHAAANPLPETFSFLLNQTNTEISTNELRSWQGELIIPQNSNIFYEPEKALELALKNVNIHFLPPAPSTIKYPYQLSQIYASVETLAKKINYPATEPELTIYDNRAEKFIPPEDGLIIDTHTSTFNALRALTTGQNFSQLSVIILKPQNTLKETNSLGINELIAKGESNFKGSPKNRRHNIQIGIEKFKGIIIKKGQEFSFNEYLGPVEAENGFLPELVIKKTGTVPELGGGLCQVSSTTFRAAMKAGLPITERKNHAYAVQYYTPQGTDATIYPGIVDLKFINDTPGDILIWPYLKAKDNLVFDFYGTLDSREVTLFKPAQYDRKEDGSLKAEWIRLVEKNGINATSTFKSTYQSPALFHKQEEFVSASTAPVTTLNNSN